MTAAGPASCRGSMPIRRRRRSPLSSRTRRTAGLWWTTSPRRCTRPRVRSRCRPSADELEKQATDTRVDPRPYVGEYESVALVFRVIPHEDGIALRVRGKVRFYETDTLEESPPLPLRPMGDGHFTTGQALRHVPQSRRRRPDAAPGLSPAPAQTERVRHISVV